MYSTYFYSIYFLLVLVAFIQPSFLTEYRFMSIHEHYETAAEDKISLIKKIIYGFGAFINNLLSAAISTMTIVLNLGLGMNPALVGLLGALPRLIDAFTDPLMGYISDHTKSKWGRRRPYIFIGAVIAAIAFALLWQLPRDQSENFYFWYFLIGSIIFYLAYTVFATPWVALGYELTPDYHERTRIMAVQNFLGQFAWLFAPWFLLFMQNESLFSDMIEGASWLAIIIGIVTLCIGILPAIFLAERHSPIPTSPSVSDSSVQSESDKSLLGAIADFFKGFLITIKFKPFLSLCGATFLVFNGFMMVSAFQSYVIIYYVFGGDQALGAEYVGWAGTVSFIATSCAIFIVTKLSSLFGKRNAFFITIVISIFGYALKWICFTPDNPILVIIPPIFFSFGLGGLFTLMGSMMVKGFQGDKLSDTYSIAACAKHFAGYGASESGRDYNTTNIPENELRNVYLPPFKAVADEGISTFMASFSDLNGVPATGNKWLLNDILRTEWQYPNFVVSDWGAISQLITHGFAVDEKAAAFKACSAGIDMEMASDNYAKHLVYLIQSNKISIEKIDTMVSRILKLKIDLGLFDTPFTPPPKATEHLNSFHLTVAKQAAIKSCVLLKNNKKILPLSKATIDTLAVIGPLADDGYEQLGTWAFDGKAEHSITCLKAIKDYVENSVDVKFAIGMETSRCNHQDGFDEAIHIASSADVAIMVLGEEAILSGEAHCRSNIDLPGAQEQLIEAIYDTGTPIVLVVMAGRPIILEKILPKVDAILFAWHPGTMGGVAITELLFGQECPSGKLPVTFPRVVGQIPIYYGQKNTGRPACEETFVDINSIKVRAPQTSLGMTSTHLDTHFSPLFPFGFGLSYTQFKYEDIKVSKYSVTMGETFKIAATISNIGKFDADEIVQLYIRDLVGSVTRPVKELKGFKRIFLTAGQSKIVIFEIHTDKLAFYNQQMELSTEAGLFHAWIGGSSDSDLKTEFEVILQSE